MKTMENIIRQWRINCQLGVVRCHEIIVFINI